MKTERDRRFQQKLGARARERKERERLLAQAKAAPSKPVRVAKPAARKAAAPSTATTKAQPRKETQAPRRADKASTKADKAARRARQRQRQLADLLRAERQKERQRGWVIKRKPSPPEEAPIRLARTETRRAARESSTVEKERKTREGMLQERAARRKAELEEAVTEKREAKTVASMRQEQEAELKARAVLTGRLKEQSAHARLITQEKKQQAAQEVERSRRAARYAMRVSEQKTAGRREDKHARAAKVKLEARLAQKQEDLEKVKRGETPSVKALRRADEIKASRVAAEEARKMALEDF